MTIANFTHYWAENKLKDRFNVSPKFVNQVPLYALQINSDEVLE